MTQNNLGLVYTNRISGDKAENLEKAIAAFEQALQVSTREANPIDWAMTQNNLGAAYRYRISGDRVENLEKAIAAFEQALQVCTREALPIQWAATQNNLGVIYVHRISGDSAENLEKAITSFESALQVYTPETLPILWAETQMNLGTAYHTRISGSDRTENSEKAIEAYEQALKVFTPEADPIKCLETFQNLGNLHFTQSDWQKAVNVYENATTAGELSRSRATTDKNRQKIMEKAIAVYQKLVQAYINIEQWDKAIETVERSKTRNLVELLAKRHLYPKGDVPQQIIEQLDQLRRNIPSLERQLQVVIDQLSGRLEEQKRHRLSLEESQQRLKEQLQESQQQLNEILNQIKPFDPGFSLTQKVETIPFQEIQSLVDKQTAMIQWYFTGDGLITSIITQHSSPLIFISSSAEDREAFIDWGKKYLGAYDQQREQWKKYLSSHLAELAKILRIDETLAEINKIFGYQDIRCDRLILIPHLLLHLLPLHALPLENGDLLIECFPKGVSYAPSCQLLQQLQTIQRNDFYNLFAIQEPKNSLKPLPYAHLEVEAIKTFFSSAEVLTGEKATIDNAKLATTDSQDRQSSHYLHFACHGGFNFVNPLESNLALSGDESLTLGNLFEREFNFSQCRLVVLSACETGLIDPRNTSDEYIGLPSGFLYAGSSSVVSSLWTVDDQSTAFLMIRFMQNFKAAFEKNKEASVALTLNQAQLWLRDATQEELKIWANRLQLPKEQAKRIKDFLRKFASDEQPFHAPQYWAAFCAIGK